MSNFESKINLSKMKILSIKFLFKRFGSYTDYKTPEITHSQLKKDLLKFKKLKNVKKEIKISKFQKNIFEITI